MQARASVATMWTRWAIGAVVTGFIAFGAVFLGGVNSVVVLGWAAGMIFAASLILFRRRY